MMINKRLIGTVSESKKYVAGNVALQWCSLAANIAMMTALTGLLASLYEGTSGAIKLLIVAALALVLRYGVYFISDFAGLYDLPRLWRKDQRILESVLDCVH